jgi:chromosome segregation ATPase
MLKKVLILVVFLFTSTLAQKEEVDKEIARLKKEIEKVETQRKEEAKEIQKEMAEFEAYNQRHRQKIEGIKKQTDSLKTLLKEFSLKNDSLNQEISSTNLKIKEYDLQKENIKNSLLKSIKDIISQLDNFPPILQEQYKGSLKYLYSELESGNSELSEALYRLTKIAGEIRTASQEIQVVESSSPISQVKGSVYRLRIGGIFEAVIEKEGKEAFVWNSYYKKWSPVDQASIEALIKAVKIKEGKIVPELVNLPLGELASEKRGDK